ncbi:glutamate 5-kinase [Candidatus Falkowbacteria bacterium]|nr:glutamate 5-kinase [Candidatus Falkowbacteria bacterium]
MNNTLVIKIGTNVILGNGSQVNFSILKNIAAQICKLKEKGYKIILVSSGAVGASKELVQKSQEKHSISFLAAIGQTVLINHYQNIFKQKNQIIAQVLLTGDDFLNRQRYNFIYETLTELLKNNIIPIINENDVVTRDYWGFGENDFLAAITAININADKIIFLTNVDGIYDKNPKEKDAKLISNIKNVNEIDVAKTTSTFGKGGMASKVNAANLAANAGIEGFVINGLKEKNLEKLILDTSKIGTRIKASSKKLNQKRGWLFIGKLRPGKIFIDRGAGEAIKSGNSLLAIGVKEARGNFHNKDVVSVLDEKNNIIGYGTVNYDFEKLKKIKGMEKNEIKKHYEREIIHRDNLTILK